MSSAKKEANNMETSTIGKEDMAINLLNKSTAKKNEIRALLHEDSRASKALKEGLAERVEEIIKSIQTLAVNYGKLDGVKTATKQISEDILQKIMQVQTNTEEAVKANFSEERKNLKEATKDTIQINDRMKFYPSFADVLKANTQQKKFTGQQTIKSTKLGQINKEKVLFIKPKDGKYVTAKNIRKDITKLIDPIRDKIRVI